MMLKKWEKKILFVGMQWDYGKMARGLSGEKLWFYDTFEPLVSHIDVFWYDEYLRKTDQLQELIIQKADEVKPDLIVFIPYTDQFSHETLDILKGKYPTYAWFGDDQWRFSDYSSLYAPHFTYISTTDPWSVSKYKKIGVDPILTQWAGRIYSQNIGVLREDEEFEYDVSFIGGENDFRSWFISELLKYGIKVYCFGAGWSNDRISYEQMEQIFRKSKINLNISNSANNDIHFILSHEEMFEKWRKAKKRAEQIKARNFEIPLAGGFQLSNYVLGLEQYLKIGEEVAVYTSPEECAQQIEFYLENEDLRKEITYRSHEKVIKEHTYLHRLSNILEEIWK